jgi:hypothetical protein
VDSLDELPPFDEYCNEGIVIPGYETELAEGLDELEFYMIQEPGKPYPFENFRHVD